jgi:ADP-ribose pyrophosphatase YjhB (NUDIX family)
MTATTIPPAQRLVQIAEQLRALGSNGLHFSKLFHPEDHYQLERYEKVLHLAAELLSLAATQPQAEIERIFLADIDMKAPLAVVDTAVFDDADRLLLIRRADNGLWALPGGACDVGETPATAGAREVWEETGYTVRVTHLLGLFDGNYLDRPSARHLYHLLFAGEVTGGDATTSSESPEVAWVSAVDIPWDRLSPGHAPRIRHAVAWRADPASTPPYFE